MAKFKFKNWLVVAVIVIAILFVVWPMVSGWMESRSAGAGGQITGGPKY